MSHASARKTHPHLPLAVAFGLAIAALTLVAGARLAGFTPEQHGAEAAVVESRLLRFQRSAANEVEVVDAGTGETILRAGKEGFIPGVLRALDRLRRGHEAPASEAYRLELLNNGQLMLTDTTSGMTLDLAAYGQVNARVFAAFLPSTGDQS